MPIVFALLLVSSWLGPPTVLADEVRVAAAANFVPTLERLAARFTAVSGHSLLIASASTGKHYAQIRNGARFDVFLAADAERPARLEADGIGMAGSRFVYALGRLALWMPQRARIDDIRAALSDPDLARLSIANPRLAPYGRAARDVLEAWGLWEPLRRRIVRGENIAQAYQFVATGNAPAGLVAWSQLRTAASEPVGAVALVPEQLYAPIEQHALLLRDTSAARALMCFLQSDDARAIIEGDGYRIARGA